MHYDFIEIGTSDFETVVESCTDQMAGICVEPIWYYLDRLPRRPYVRYLCQAVTDSEDGKDVEVYWIHPEDIRRYSLPDWLRGCNSIDKPHPRHLDQNLPPSILRKDLVRTLSLRQLFEENKVTSVEYLKIDTEGADCKILLAFAQTPNRVLPRLIRFESNSLCSPSDVKLIKEVYTSFGYSVSESGENTVLIRKTTP